MCEDVPTPATPARHMPAMLEARVGLKPAHAVKRILEMIAMDITDTAAERGSANVFADLGLDDADVHLLKAGLVSCIDDIVHKRGITETEAAGCSACPSSTCRACCAATSVNIRFSACFAC